LNKGTSIIYGTVVYGEVITVTMDILNKIHGKVTSVTRNTYCNRVIRNTYHNLINRDYN